MTDECGYFPRESLLRRVHRERAVGVLYGQRALCIGAANPLNYVVTAIYADPYPAGSPYSALDSELLMWTITVMADSAQYIFRLPCHQSRVFRPVATLVDAGRPLSCYQMYTSKLTLLRHP
jgi:hypothetical protein